MLRGRKPLGFSIPVVEGLFLLIRGSALGLYVFDGMALAKWLSVDGESGATEIKYNYK